MKKKRRLKTNVAISFIYTLVVLCMISFSFILPTNSKFITAGPGGKEGTALIYQVGLYPLYVNTPSLKDDQIGITVDENDSTVFTFSFEFKRHYDIAYDVSDTNKDNYSFIVTPGCTIQSINGNTENVNSISFDNRGDTDSTVKVDLKCNYDTLKGNSTAEETTISVGIKEKFGIEGSYEQEFLYTEPSFIISDEYYSEIANIKKWENPLVVPNGTSNADRIAMYKEWIELYTEKYGNASLVKSYALRDGFENYITRGTEQWQGINGIAMTYRSGTYTYKIEDNFIGYAKTENAQSVNPNTLYFTTVNESEISKAFSYYLKVYQQKKNYTDQQINEILEYINKRSGKYDESGTLIRDGILDIVLGKKIVLGVRTYPSEDLVVLDERLLEYAMSLKDPQSTNIVFDSFSAMEVDFKAFLTTLEEKIITPGFDVRAQLESQFTSRLEYFNGLYKNNNSGSPSYYPIKSSFIDYYAVLDEEMGHYLILKVKSDVSKDATHQYNTYEFRTLALEKRENYSYPSISFTNSSSNQDTLNIFIELEAATEEEAKRTIFDDILAHLNEYFGENKTEADVDFIWDDGYASAEFTVSKGYDDLLPTGGVGSAQRSKEKTESVIELVEKAISDMNTEEEAKKEENQSTQEVLDENSTIQPEEKVEEVQVPDDEELSDVKEEEKILPTEEIGENKEEEEEKETSLPMINSIMSFFLRK